MMNTRTRRRRYKRRKRGSIVKIAALVLLILVMAAAAGCAGYVYYIIHNADEIDTTDIYSLVGQRSTLYDDNGKKLEDLYFTGANRDIVGYDEMPQTMINAIVSIEDKTFWKHHGFNIIRMMGAVKEKVFGGGQISGTSTITQQLARNVYLADQKSERTVSRKITECYYAWQLEKALSKEQILEAYLNTVYFGFDSYGIEAAAGNYFSCHAKELSDTQCVALAALPQSPDVYALVRYTENGNIEYNGDATAERRSLIMDLMQQEGYLPAEQRAQIESDDLEKLISISEKKTSPYSYYTDYAIEQVTGDLAKELSISEKEARMMIYTKGLSIYTELDTDIQKILNEEINDASNYTGISYLSKDSDGNLLSSQGTVVARPYSSYFSDKGTFKLKDSEFDRNEDGSVTLYKGKRLAFYELGEGVSISFKTLYTQDGGLSLIDGGNLSVPEEFTSFDSDENCVISAQFVKDNPDFFNFDDGKLKIKKDYYYLAPERKQPQAAAVIIENDTGIVKAMCGGRGSGGKKLYNRAINPRQPGSSIKPIAVYGPALQLSAEAAEEGESINLENTGGNNFGKYITAGSVINDAKTVTGGRVWPRNSYGGYRGKMTLRKAVQLSCNVAAYKTFRQVGEENSIEFLKKLGISSIVESGERNDLGPALCLGGMTRGISPLEMTAAFSTFPSGGIYREPKLYSSVTDSDGNILLEAQPKETRVWDEGVAWIMTDILQSVVSSGTGTNARIGTQPVGGKTGTTTNQYDVWFAGFSPEYSCATWEGCDANIALTSSSSAAASFWAAIMKRVCTGSASFSPMPDDVEKIRGEYYVKGTYSGVHLTPETKKKEKKTEKKEHKDSNSYEDENGIEFTKPVKDKDKDKPEPTTKADWEDEFDWN